MAFAIFLRVVVLVLERLHLGTNCPGLIFVAGVFPFPRDEVALAPERHLRGSVSVRHLVNGQGMREVVWLASIPERGGV